MYTEELNMDRQEREQSVSWFCVRFCSSGKGDTMKNTKKWKSRLWKAVLPLLLSGCCLASAAAAPGGNVTITNEKGMKYPAAWGNHATHYYTATTQKGTSVAYCLEPVERQIPTGQYTEEILEGNQGLEAALYYSYGGPGQSEYIDQTDYSNIGNTSLEDAKYIRSHLAVSYFYDPEKAFYGMTEENIQNSGVMDFIHWLEGKTAPSVTSSFSETELTAYYEEGTDRQRTPSMQYLSEEPENQITIACPEGVVLHNETTGREETGNVILKADDSFYFTAPLNIAALQGETWKVQGLTGTRDGRWQVMKITATGDYQDSGYGCYSRDQISGTGFLVNWTSFGSLEVRKVDKETGQKEPQGKGSFQGAEYTVYKDGKEVGKILTDENGQGRLDRLLAGTYTVKETKAPPGYELDPETYTVQIPQGQPDFTAVTESREQAVKVKIHVQKKDGETGESTGQGKGTLEGAEYTVYAGEDIGTIKKDDAVGKIITDGNGRGTLENLLPGKYYVKETKASPGYFLDPETYEISFPLGQSQTEGTVTSQEKPVRGNIELYKTDSETKGNTPQVTGSSFKGAVYQVYALEDIGELKKGEKAGEIITDEKGYGKLQNLLMGTYGIKEIKAPLGYLLDETEYKAVISQAKEGAASLTVQVKSQEKPVRGDVALTKLLKDKEENGFKNPGEGIRFTFTEVGNEKNTLTITTDENGYATTADKRYPDGRLLYGTYKVTESNVPKGYTAIEPFQVTIRENQQKLYYIIENQQILCPLKVTKTAADTGKVIAKSGTRFKIQKKEGGQWKDQEYLVTYYPHEIRQTVFETDESGSFYLPEKLKTGDYRVVEVAPPPGYALNMEPVEFSVTDEMKDSQGLEVTVQDQPQKGRLQILKLDEESGESAGEGFTFSITAAEEIRTGDGTFRLEKGEKAGEVTTDKEGKAVSGELFPGKYIVKEEQPGEYYALGEESYEIDIAPESTEEVFQITIKPENKKTKVILHKTDKTDPDKELEGARFRLYREEELTEEELEDLGERIPEKGRLAVTDKEGKLLFTDLCHDTTYYLAEVQAAPGYIRSQEVYQLYVDEKGLISRKQEKTIEISNTPLPKGSLLITKTDQDTGENLGKGFVFEVHAAEDIMSYEGQILYKKDDLVDTIETDEKGLAESKELFPGKYLVWETKTGEYYALDQKKYETEIQLNEENQITKGELRIENKKTCFNLEKTDKETGEPLQDVVFSLGTWEEEPDREFLLKEGKRLVTDKEGRITFDNLKHGCTYYLTEAEPLEGYQEDTQIYSFQVDEDGLIQKEKEYTLKLTNTVKTEEVPKQEDKPENKNDRKEDTPKKVQTVETEDRIPLAEMGLLWTISGTCLLALAWRQKRRQK